MDEYPFTEHVQAISPLDGRAIDGSRRQKPRQVRQSEAREFPVTVTRIHPNTRRLTHRMEERGAEMFAKGWSERQVARALGIGNGTANRLKKRLQQASQNEKRVTVPQVAASAPQGEITDLESRRAQLARELEELDSQLFGARGAELDEAVAAMALVAPRWGPLADVWARMENELLALRQTLARDHRA